MTTIQVVTVNLEKRDFFEVNRNNTEQDAVNFFIEISGLKN